MNDKDLHTDRELFMQIAAGDENAFATIFHKYNRLLYPAIVKMVKSQTEAKEIVQNTFLKLWLNRQQLTEIEAPGAWLNRVAANFALNSLRDRATYDRHILIAGQSMAADDDELELNLNARELKKLITEAVEVMPEGRQKVFTMSRYDGMSRHEIAQQLGISESTVKNQLSSSLKFIQEYLVKKHGIHLPLTIFLLFY